jgi:hypothetical protein
LIVIAGFQPSSSFKMDKQTVPEGYTLGWNNGGTNLPVCVSFNTFGRKTRFVHFGGFVGYSAMQVSAVEVRRYTVELAIREDNAQLE